MMYNNIEIYNFNDTIEIKRKGRLNSMEDNIKLNKLNIKSVIESILFAYAEPITAEELRRAIDVELSAKDIENIISELIEEYSRDNRGIQIFKINNSYQMGTNKDNYDFVKAVLNPQKSKSLSQAASEVLTIIAYEQPITKVEIEDIRGVKSDGIVSTLLELNLIREAGRLDKIGKPIIYKTTDETLKLLGIESLKDLPSLESFKDDVELRASLSINEEKVSEDYQLPLLNEIKM